MKITSILFITTSVHNYETLLKGVVGNIKVVVLDPIRDGVAQITDVLSQYSEVESVHIVSHGSPGTLYLGNSELSLKTLEFYADQLKNWFSSSPHLLLYGCQVAAGDAGAEFLTKLHQLTGASISASSNPTGSIALGGDWNLEMNIGNISNQSLAFSTEVMAAYSSILSLIPVQNLDTPGNAEGIVVEGNYAYIADAGSGLQIINISDPNNPIIAGSYDTPGNAFNVAVAENYAYVADGSSLQIIDVSNPNNPTLKTNVDNLSGTTYAVTVLNNFAYVAVRDAGLQIIDLSNLDVPTLRGSYNTPGNASGVAVVGNYAYIADGDSGLQIIDITNPDALTLKGSYDTSGFANTVTVAGNYAYIADDDSGLQIIDITSPDNPTLKGSYDTPGAAKSVIIVENLAYVTDFESGIQIIDVSDPSNPTLKNSQDTPDNAEDIAVVGNYLYFADSGSGLQIFQNNTPPTAANKTIAINKDTTYTFVTTDFSFADSDSGDSLQKVQITQLPVVGQLFQDINSNNLQEQGEEIALEQEILVADFNKLKFKAAADATGINYANFQFKVNDGSEYSSAAYTMTIDIAPTNTAPVLSDTDVILSAVKKDASLPVGAVGTLISSLVSVGGNIIDPDPGAVAGIAITSVDTTNGSWFYSIDNGSNWTALGVVSNANALLLTADSNTRIYFQPNGSFSGTINNALTFRAWDTISGSNGGVGDTTINGGDTTFSSNTDTAAIIVNAVNTAPVLSDMDVMLTAVKKDASLPVGAVGTLVSSLVSVGGNIIDPDPGAVAGIAITSTDTTNGSWFYSIDNGSSWTALGTVSNANALLLTADSNTRIYFQPNGSFSGTVNNALTFRAWDTTTGSNGSRGDTTINGGETAFSSITDTAVITVNAVNTAPVLNDTDVILTAVNQDAGTPSGAVGTLMSNLVALGDNVIDTDKDALTGVAITNADTANGNWYYSTNDGMSWASLGLISNENARLLAADDKTRVYFQPQSNFIGTVNNALTFRAWDTTSGSNGGVSDTTINGGETAFSSTTDTAAITVHNKISTPNTPVKLNQVSESVFQFEGNGQPTLEVSLTGSSSSSVNELVAFVVDDQNGTINGIAPGGQDYLQAALAKAKVVFSTIANVPNGFDTNLKRTLEFNSGDSLGFALIRNSSLDAVRSGETSLTNVLVSNTIVNRVTNLGNGEFSLNWNDASGNSATNLQDLAVKIRATDEPLPLGVSIQGDEQAELIDVRDATTPLNAEFILHREAAFDNFVGFYRVADVNGGIDTNGDGTVDLLPGDAGYTQAAIQGRVAGIDLSVSNQSRATFTGTFEPGAIFASFMIVDGTPDAILDSNSSNDPAVYFSFLGANSDRVDHIRLLGNNTFGFEDLAGGGDRDYNDVIVKVNFNLA
ncbi:MAG: DUF4347 domain-containing protein [Scytonema sp. PMC 1070.18]|nr:DUF4347 domain-containing protein [Scytonema sp. PMC 1070.18]